MNRAIANDVDLRPRLNKLYNRTELYLKMRTYSKSRFIHAAAAAAAQKAAAKMRQ